MSNGEDNQTKNDQIRNNESNEDLTNDRGDGRTKIKLSNEEIIEIK